MNVNIAADPASNNTLGLFIGYIDGREVVRQTLNNETNTVLTFAVPQEFISNNLPVQVNKI